MLFDAQNLVIDLELSSHCNANCYFCPRDTVPFLKHMEREVFETVFDRLDALPSRPRITLCGTGDASVHPDVVGLVRRAVERGYDLEMVTNGIAVDRVMAQGLVNAGLQHISFSIAETDKAYEAIYSAPFERVVANVLGFRDLAGDRCEVRINIIADLISPRRLARARKFWQEKGITNFLALDYTNRAGLLSLGGVKPDHAPLLSELGVYDVKGICPVPFKFIHIGADGTCYLCSHDFARRVSFGHVRDHSLVETLKRKLAYFDGPASVCQNCTNHPARRVRDLLQVGESREVIIRGLHDVEAQTRQLIDELSS